MVWPLHLGDLEAVEARAIERGVGEIRRGGGGANGVAKAPAAHEFHGTRIERCGARMLGRAVALLHHQTWYVARSQFDGGGEAHRAPADNEHRRL